jgi:ketosteroid isomerase-like protein
VIFLSKKKLIQKYRMKGFEMRKLITVLIILLPLITLGNISLATSISETEKEVADTERAFAKTMADRNLEAFKSFLAEDAVFWNEDAELRGIENIVAVWQNYFDGSDAPFAWEPQTVMVLDSGDLALSTGPVWGSDNNIRSYFTSIWRKNAQGSWKIVFDKGQKYCAP